LIHPSQLPCSARLFTDLWLRCRTLQTQLFSLRCLILRRF
jgi:hypothetical protein